MKPFITLIFLLITSFANCQTIEKAVIMRIYEGEGMYSDARIIAIDENGETFIDTPLKSDFPKTRIENLKLINEALNKVASKGYHLKHSDVRVVYNTIKDDRFFHHNFRVYKIIV